jgi:hypothetical protein
MKVQTSLLTSKSIIVHPSHCRSVVALQDDDMGEQYHDSNILFLGEYIDEASGDRNQGTFTLPADANRDKTSLEWVLAPKDTTTVTLNSFNDLVQSRHMQIASTGGLSGIAAITAGQTGYSNINTEEEIDLQLAESPEEADRLLVLMQEVHGKEALSKMRPDELYRAYKDFIVSGGRDARQ